MPWINIPFAIQNDINSHWMEEDEEYNCGCTAQLPKYLLCMYHTGMYVHNLMTPDSGRYILCDYAGESPLYHDPNDDSFYRNPENK